MSAQAWRHSLTARPQEADAAVVALRSRASALLEGTKLDRFEIAIAEALSNVVKHAHPDGRPGRVAILCDFGEESVTVSIRDHGRPAPRETFEEPAVADDDPLRESGRGVALIRQCADGLEYRSDQDGNELTLTFRREAAAS